MSKADSLRSTPVSGVNRRGLLRCAGGIAAAAALVGTNPTAALAGSFGLSPELLSWRKARAAYMDAWGRHKTTIQKWHYEFLRSHIDVPGPIHPADTSEALLQDPTIKAIDVEMGAKEEVLDAAVEILLKRPIRSWHDVAELAEMVRGEHRWFPGERHESDEHAADSDVTALFDAIAMMAAKEVANV